MKRVIGCHSASILAMILVCVMNMSIFASATVVTVQPCYLTISMFSSNLSISATGRAEVYSSVLASHADYSVDLVVELQQWRGTSWSTIKSWKISKTGYAETEEHWYVVMGHKYRVHASATVYDQNGKVLERATKNSATVTY